MEGIDPTAVRPGERVRKIWDDLDGRDVPARSCHCSYRVVTETSTTKSGGRKRVIAHDLLPGDVIVGVHERQDEGGCHCDVFFTVLREPSRTEHPCRIGTRVSHYGQKWHRAHMGGTATVTGAEGPYSDGSYEYTVHGVRDFSRRSGPDNPEDAVHTWSSVATRRV